MSSFTPGPWMAAARHSSVVGWPICQPATGRLICNINYVQRTSIDPSVAGDQAFNAESKANARLIAAAPDLLKALQVLVKINRDLDSVGVMPADKAIAYGMAEAAIAKATGGA